MPTEGFAELQRQLKRMSAAVGGKALRSAGVSAMLPALRAAQASAPSGDPPYGPYGARAAFDPYPRTTHKGRKVAPGFTARNVARKSKLSRDKSFVKVMLGVRPEAFAAVQFVELGTSTRGARPWLEPAFRRSIPAVDRRFRARLAALIKKAAR